MRNEEEEVYTTNTSEFSVSSIFEYCKLKVDISKLTAPNNRLCVDGTSACYKTSILNKLRQTYEYYKIQQNHNINNMNTYGLSVFGYIASGIIDQYNYAKPTFMDRSPLNPLEWSTCIWTLMTQYANIIGNRNLYDGNPDDDAFIANAVDFIQKFCDLDFYKMFRSECNTIAIVNTNSDMVRSIQYTRGSNSDQERSSWVFYPMIQTLFYQHAYKNLYIDLNWFNGTAIETIIEGVANFLIYAINNKPGKWSADNQILLQVKRPYKKEDIATINMGAHVLRSTNRMITSVCLKNENSDTAVKRYKSQIPSTVTVINETLPMLDVVADVTSHINASVPYNHRSLQVYTGEIIPEEEWAGMDDDDTEEEDANEDE